MSRVLCSTFYRVAEETKKRALLGELASYFDCEAVVFFLDLAEIDFLAQRALP